MTTNSFNLIDEKWIITVDKGLVSLKEIFSDPEIKQLGGSAIEKLSIFKLLLAIAQSAYTPKDDQSWYDYSTDAMTSTICKYLDKFHDRFFLYSEDNPFLQFPVLSCSRSRSSLYPFSVVQPHVASGNNALRTQSECPYNVDEKEAARILVGLMNFAFGGKKAEKSLSLPTNCKDGKLNIAKVGIGLNEHGYLHSYFLGKNLIESIRLNLLTIEDIESLNMFSSGLGTPLWEKMPTGEDDDTAKAYKQSLLGRLVSLGRFCLLEEDGLYLTEGLSYLDHKDGVCDPAVCVDKSGEKTEAVWCDPEKAPWRSFPAILSFISGSQPSVICQQLQLCGKRIRNYFEPVAIWSSGQKVSRLTAGEFKVSRRDDSVDCLIWVDKGDILSEEWYELYAKEVESLERLSKTLYAAIMGYLRDVHRIRISSKDNSIEEKTIIPQSNKHIYKFWENVEPFSQDISDSCVDFENKRKLRAKFAIIAERVYDEACPSYTEHQLKAWSRHKLNTYNYKKIGE